MTEFVPKNVNETILVSTSARSFSIYLDYLSMLSRTLRDPLLTQALEVYLVEHHRVVAISDPDASVTWQLGSHFFNTLASSGKFTEDSLQWLHRKYRRNTELFIFTCAYRRLTGKRSVFPEPSYVVQVSPFVDLGISNQSVWDVHVSETGEEYIVYVKDGLIKTHLPTMNHL